MTEDTTRTEDELHARGVMTAIIEHQKTDEKFRAIALRQACYLEHELPFPQEHDREHPQTCAAMMGTGHCDCPALPLAERHEQARAVEEAIVDRVLRHAETFANYMKWGATPEFGRQMELEAEMRAAGREAQSLTLSDEDQAAYLAAHQTITRINRLMEDSPGGDGGLLG